MDNATELQNKGIEPTNKRVAIYSLFVSSSTPLSATAIITQMVGQSIHRATVFRTIQLLEEKKLIKRIDFAESESLFEIASLPHHHHLLCKTCGTIGRIDICEIDDIKKQAKKQLGFTTVDHSLTLFGVCKKCIELV